MAANVQWTQSVQPESTDVVQVEQQQKQEIPKNMAQEKFHPKMI